MIRQLRSTAMVAVPTAMVLASALPASAGETEEIHGEAELKSILVDEMKVGGNPGAKVFIGVDEASFSNERGRALTDARYQVFWLFFPDASGADKVVGYKIFTMPDESSVLARFESTKTSSQSSDGKSRGKWTLLGGTGAYEGVTGSGTYVYTSISDVVGTDILDGMIERP